MRHRLVASLSLAVLLTLAASSGATGATASTVHAATASLEPTTDTVITEADLFQAEPMQGFVTCTAGAACPGGSSISCTGFGVDACRSANGCWIICNNMVTICPGASWQCPDPWRYID